MLDGLNECVGEDGDREPRAAGPWSRRGRRWLTPATPGLRARPGANGFPGTAASRAPNLRKEGAVIPRPTEARSGPVTCSAQGVKPGRPPHAVATALPGRALASCPAGNGGTCKVTTARGVPPSPAGKRVLHEPPSRDRPSHCTSQRRTPRPGGRGCRRGKAAREGRLARTPRRAAGARLASRGASLAHPEATPAGPEVPVALGGARWLLSRKAQVLTESSAKGSSAKCVCLEPFSLLIIVIIIWPDPTAAAPKGKGSGHLATRLVRTGNSRDGSWRPRRGAPLPACVPFIFLLSRN